MEVDNERSYDLISGQWQQFRNSTAINKCIKDFTKFLPPNGKILDIGCGTGYPVAQYLTESDFFVTGIDVSRQMIDRANGLKLKNAEFIKRDILDFSSDTLFDGVIAFDSLWHIAKDRQAEAYKKIASLMKSGAYFLFTHGNRNGETVGEMFNQKFYYGALSISELTSLFDGLGLKIVSFKEHYKEKTTGERDLLAVVRKL